MSWATDDGFLLKKNGIGLSGSGSTRELPRPTRGTGSRTRLFLLNAFPAVCTPLRVVGVRRNRAVDLGLQLLDTLRQPLHLGLELAEEADTGEDRPDSLV